MSSNDPKPAHVAAADEPAVAWYRRRRFLVVAAAVVIVLVTVLTDLPENATRPVQVRGDDAAIEQVNGLTQGCRFAVTESFKILRDESRPGGLSAHDRSLVPSLLTDDQNACSFTNDDIYNLSDVEVPPGGAGRDLQHMVNTVILWTTSDALAAIEAIQGLSERPLSGRPPSHKAAGALKRAEHGLGKDRGVALGEWRRAEHILRAHLIRLELPATAH